jgi:hypothetical protein
VKLAAEEAVGVERLEYDGLLAGADGEEALAGRERALDAIAGEARNCGGEVHVETDSIAGVAGMN